MRASLAVWAVWLGLFLLLELPAAFGWTPWRTLSATSWFAEDWWPGLTLILEAFLAVLLLHICFRLSAGALIFVVCAGAVALGLHLFGVRL